LGTNHSSTKGPAIAPFITRRAARSLRTASRRADSRENSARNHLADSFRTW
jgi:hypothetical protein